VAQLRVTTAVAAVLTVFLTEPDSPRYGLELMHATGQASGTLYPILTRLHRAGWVAGEWESADASEIGRPPRRYYRLTPEGVTAGRDALATIRRSLGITGAPATGLA
jgi:DNA-binding PadR family transcriptional regulator